jgi:hypothetical protein
MVDLASEDEKVFLDLVLEELLLFLALGLEVVEAVAPVVVHVVNQVEEVLVVLPTVLAQQLDTHVHSLFRLGKQFQSGGAFLSGWVQDSPVEIVVTSSLLPTHLGRWS